MIAKERDFDNDLSITWKHLIPRLVPNPLKGKLPVYFPSTSLGPRQDLRQHVRKYRGIAAIIYLPTDAIMHFFFCIANNFAQLRVKYITELSCKAEGIAQEQIQGRGLKVPPAFLPAPLVLRISPGLTRATLTTCMELPVPFHSSS